MPTLPVAPAARPERTHHALALALCAGGLAILGACGGGGTVRESQSGLAPGSLALLPNQAPGSALSFLVSPNSGGRATSLQMRGIRWGKLADIRDQTGALRHKDFVVDENVTSGNDYVVESNPVTEKTTVTIRAPFDTAPGSAYVTLLAALEANLTLLEDKSLDPSELPPYPLVPRNATLVVEFNDLLDAATIGAQTFKIQRGYPPTTPFDARIFPDPNHGDLAEFDGLPGMEYYTTRVILDTTVSAIEAAETNPPLPVNTLGLPSSLTQGQPNVALRIPTQLDANTGQVMLLENPTNHRLSTSGNGSQDTSVATRDIVRALRSGGGVLGDLNNGFLVDTVPPSVLGTQGAFVQNLAQGPTPASFVCDLVFALPTCAMRLRAGDVLQQNGVYAEVICPPSQSCPQGSLVTGGVSAGVVSAVYFRIIATNAFGQQTLEEGPAQVSIRYHSGVVNAQAPCFLRFPTVTLPPDQGVAPSSPVIVRFSEPMDPLSIKPFDSFMLLRRDPAVVTTPTAYDFVVGAITNSADLREFTFTPNLPLTHATNGSESYWLQVLSGALGAKDLPGNELESGLQGVRFRLDPQANAQSTGGFAFRFRSLDELESIGGATTGTDSTVGIGKREWRGQLLIDAQKEVLRPRPVTHFKAAADRTQAIPSIFQAFPQGLQTPLSKLGSKLQTLWRYCDVGFPLLDESNYNVDVEGLAWSPRGGAVIADNFTRFEIGLSHCKYLPDESVDGNLLLIYPASGLLPPYSGNHANPALDPQRKMYPITGGPTGYSVIPTDMFQGATGTNLMPWPMNRGIPTKDFVFYTWRDTSLGIFGGPGNPGAELAIVTQITGVGTTGQPYTTGNIPSVGLPILLEFRCYPDDDALGLNAFEVAVVTATSSRPNFRAFSTGGVNQSGQIVKKDPDLQTTATGGFNPVGPPAGVATIPVDNTFYIGQLSLVSRISRVHSIWFDTGSGTVQYGAPVLEPRSTDQPDGTSVILAYRGASTHPNANSKSDAAVLNPYGDVPATATTAYPGANTGIVFLNGDANWKTSLSALNGARFFQVRITFLSNAESNLSPELSALGFTYRN